MRLGGAISYEYLFYITNLASFFALLVRYLFRLHIGSSHIFFQLVGADHLGYRSWCCRQRRLCGVVAKWEGPLVCLVENDMIYRRNLNN